jgi:hypothetical protein
VKVAAPLHVTIVANKIRGLRFRPNEDEMMGNMKDAVADRTTLMRHLRELIEALDRRVPHLERTGEIRIARDAAALKKKALERLARLSEAIS